MMMDKCDGQKRTYASAIARVRRASSPALGSPSPKRKEKTASRNDIPLLLLEYRFRPYGLVVS